MTTKAEFLRMIEHIPDEAEIQILQEYDVPYGSGVRWVDITEDHIEVIDLRGNPHVQKDSPNYGKVFVQIGEAQ